MVGSGEGGSYGFIGCKVLMRLVCSFFEMPLEVGFVAADSCRVLL